MFRNLERLPGSPQLHRWADWAELLCIHEGGLTAPGLGTEIEKQKDFILIDTDDDIESDVALPEPLKNPFETPAEFSDAVAQRASDTFAFIEARSNSYGDAYPFAFDATSTRLDLRPLTEARTLYLFLLVCSTFRYVDGREVQTSLAGRFEWLSLQALRRQLPVRANVHLFGANPSPGAHYGTGVRARVRQLSADIREALLLDVDKEFDSESGDGGLDLVAWLDQEDAAPGIQIAFGQCACGTEWIGKQHSSSMAAWNPFFRFTAAPLNYCFIPYDFRATDGDWYRRRSIQGSIMMDRRRLFNTVGIVDRDGRLNALDSDVAAELKLNDFAAKLSDFDWPTAG